MHYGNNKHRVVFDQINDSVREPAKKKPSSDIGDWWRGVRELCDSLSRLSDFSGEFEPETFSLVVVVADCFLQLGFGRFEELKSSIGLRFDLSKDLF